MIRILPALLAAAAVLGGIPARADESWAVAPFQASAADRETADVFQRLLRGELAQRGGIRFTVLPGSCEASACAAAAKSAGVPVTLTGELTRLGQKWIVSVGLIEADGAAVRNWQKLTVDRVEDLDQASARIADALLGGKAAADNAELGTVTRAEQEAPMRRQGFRGPGLRLGSIVPLRWPTQASPPGVVIDLSYMFETLEFGIEPRIGAHFSPEGPRGNRYLEVPLDVGAFYLFSRGDIAPFIGGGAGLRFLWDRRTETLRSGTIIPTSHDHTSTDTAFGVGSYGRIGVLLLRTWTVRVAVSADVDVAFVSLNGRSTPVSGSGCISVYF